MIGTRMEEGQGLGNRLFCYVTARCIALDRGVPFSILGFQLLQKALLAEDGEPFLEIDPGEPAEAGDFPIQYAEREERIYTGVSRHDALHGCYISGADENVLQAKDGTLLSGNLQAWEYFQRHLPEIRVWLRVRPACDNREYSRENLCVLNLRGREYRSDPGLYLRRRYWLRAMALMRRERPDMEFLIVTDDVSAANRLLPELPACHFTGGRDYVTIKNACYLILSNSSYACFPALTSDTVRKVIAPKYWARHNVSDGYWASGQNIYDGFWYMDRKGRLFDAAQCRRELSQYRRRRQAFLERRRHPSPGERKLFLLEAAVRRGGYWAGRAVWSLYRRWKQLWGKWGR